MRLWKQWIPVLTDGHIECRIKGSRFSCGVEVPDGVIFGQDNAGNMYLNGKPAWITYREVCDYYAQVANA